MASDALACPKCGSDFLPAVPVRGGLLMIFRPPTDPEPRHRCVGCGYTRSLGRDERRKYARTKEVRNA